MVARPVSEPTITCAGWRPRIEQDPDAESSGRRASCGRVQAQEQHAQAKHPREDGSDRDVPAASAPSQCADRERDRDAAAEDAGEQVESGEHPAESSRERHVAERVGREDLVPQDDEIADEPGRERDAAPSDERVAHELEREHVHAGARTPPRALTNRTAT